MSSYLDKARLWTSQRFDVGTVSQVKAMLEAGDTGALRDSFEGELEFGTAGIRGTLGVGSLRMNRYTVARAAGGLASCLLDLYPEAEGRGVVVGYDCRNGSQEFAQVVVSVLCAAGIKVMLFDRLTPTQLVPFAVRKLGAFAGVMITSSHNPPQYNGMKVYWSNGAQIISPIDRQIADRMSNDWERQPAEITHEEAKEAGLLIQLGEDMYSSYVDFALASATPRGAKGIKICYSPLGGTAWELVERAFAKAGHEQLAVVTEEKDPDPAFAGLAAPNPELPSTWKRSLELARKENAPLVLATDGDGDRIGVAVRDSDGEYVVLSGNQIGVLVLHYLLEARRENLDGKTAQKGFAISSAVSTPMAAKICRDLGIRHLETLTGFKWMGNVAEAEVASGGEFVMAFEEAFGVTFGDSRDKDGIISILLIAEAAAHWAPKGKSLLGYLDHIFSCHGLYLEDAAERFYEGVDGVAAMKKVLDGLRANPPREIAGSPVVMVRDVLLGTILRNGRQEAFDGLPKQDLLTFYCENGCWISVRPSGTEPKVKAYVGVVNQAVGENLPGAKAKAQADLKNLLKEAEAMLAG